ncbi:MAG: hypothetical protein EOP11_04090 [Proteobacteria bacterium]|nr:MAG: hypothetical protein EOP11_04090 [Pseudomonadota bacterium]
MKNWLVFSALIFMAGCSTYREPLCSDQNRVDVPNLEGRYSVQFAMVTKDGSRLTKQKFTISREARGKYTSEQNQLNTFSTCSIDAYLFLETREEKALPGIEQPAYSLSRLQKNADGSFDLVSLGVDSELLDQRKIPYQIIPRSPNQLENSPSLSTLYIDNRGVDPEFFVQLLDPVSMKFTIVPEAPGSF